MDLAEALRAVGAPAELADRVEEEGSSLEDAWSSCERGDQRLWLAACGGAPIEVILEAAAAAVLDVAEEHGGSIVLETVELAVAGVIEELPEAIEACEAASRDPSAGYREARWPGLPHAARAAVLVAHAAQGLAEGEARREAVRLDQAQRSAALLGVGSSITLPAPAEAARLSPVLAASDPAQGAFTFAVAAAAEALRECVSARLAGGTPSPEERAQVERELDALIEDALTE